MLQPTDQWKGVLGAALAMLAMVIQAFQFVIVSEYLFDYISRSFFSATTTTKNQTSLVSGTCTNPVGNKRERMKPHGTSSGKTKTSNPDKIANTGTTPTIAGRTQTPSD